MELSTGATLQNGSYSIIKSLGRGGFGITYLAEHSSTRSLVCIKEFFPKEFYKRDSDSVSLALLSDSFSDSMERYKAKFIKEAQIIGGFNHPNIIHTRDVFEENNTAYYVMDYIEGESLSDMVKRMGPLREQRAKEYIYQVAAALHHIHSKQFMHLDVKPANIMISKRGNRAILIDFGLSKHYDIISGEATSTTPIGVSHGFAPLEQYQQGGVSNFSPETDIYSLGATFYFLVTGTIPPQAATIIDSGLPTLPEKLSKGGRMAIVHSMEGLRKNRPHSTDEFLDLLNGRVAKSEVVAIAVDDEKTKIGDATTPPSREREWQPSSTDTPQPKQKSRSGCFIVLAILFAIICIVLMMIRGEMRKMNTKREKAQTTAVKHGGSRANF